MTPKRLAEAQAYLDSLEARSADSAAWEIAQFLDEALEALRRVHEASVGLRAEVQRLTELASSGDPIAGVCAAPLRGAVEIATGRSFP